MGHNKTTLVAVLAERLGRSQRDVAEVVDALVDEVAATVAAGEKVVLSGFGVFEAAERAARTGRNPRTGQTVPIAPTRAPRFRPGTDFKDRVAGGRG